MLRMPFRATWLAVVAAIVLACSDGDPISPSPVAPATPSPATDGSAPPSPQDPTTSPTRDAFDPSAVVVSLEVVTGGLESPLAVTHAGDGSGRIFVAEQGGTVRIVRDGEVVGEPFLDISERLVAGGEQGLLGLAFHPEYPSDPRLFVNYTDLDGNTVVSSFPADGDRADAAAETVILQVEQPYGNHNGGGLAFGPDGYLYIATGDGGAAGDPHDNGQSRSALLGKILRLDVDATAGDRPYAIPDDNPLVDDDGAAAEVWLLGLRNPWRFAFDRANGDMWIGDVGQGAWEEIDVVRAGEAGLNFGWNVLEGFECYRRSGSDCDVEGMTEPVAVYGHDAGCSVTGGVVYRGSDQPALAGGYVFADYCSGNVWLLDPAVRDRQEPALVLESGRSISSFGEDEAGEAYATDLAAGELLRVVGTVARP